MCRGALAGLAIGTAARDADQGQLTIEQLRAFVIVTAAHSRTVMLYERNAATGGVGFVSAIYYSGEPRGI